MMYKHKMTTIAIINTQAWNQSTVCYYWYTNCGCRWEHCYNWMQHKYLIKSYLCEGLLFHFSHTKDVTQQYKSDMIDSTLFLKKEIKICSAEVSPPISPNPPLGYVIPNCKIQHPGKDRATAFHSKHAGGRDMHLFSSFSPQQPTTSMRHHVDLLLQPRRIQTVAVSQHQEHPKYSCQHTYAAVTIWN